MKHYAPNFFTLTLFAPYSFWDILLTRLKCWNFQRAITQKKKKKKKSEFLKKLIRSSTHQPIKFQGKSQVVVEISCLQG